MRLVFTLTQVLIVSFPYGLGTANLIVFLNCLVFCLFVFKGQSWRERKPCNHFNFKKLKIVIKIFFPREKKESGKGHEGQ